MDCRAGSLCLPRSPCPKHLERLWDCSLLTLLRWDPFLCHPVPEYRDSEAGATRKETAVGEEQVLGKDVAGDGGLEEERKMGGRNRGEGERERGKGKRKRQSGERNQ